jgi:hypothetical protein
MPLPAWSGCTTFSPISPVRFGGVCRKRYEGDDLVADRHDQHMVAGVRSTDVAQQLALLGLGLRERNRGDLAADDVAERAEDRSEGELSNALERGEIGGGERAYGRSGYHRACASSALAARQH